ncbi:MAG: thiolase family protein [Chloroflexi bacterium]|nr:MAG: thiolase family protein [Chloroflexota bacterium]
MSSSATAASIAIPLSEPAAGLRSGVNVRDVWIRGAAMTRFGKLPDRSGRELVEEAVAAGLRDAEIEPKHVQAAFVGNASAGLMTGQECVRAQTVLRRTGLMGIPMTNVENACASASTALHLAWQSVAGGLRDCVVVIGYEKLHHEDRTRAHRALRAFSDLDENADVLGAAAGARPSLAMVLYGAASNGGGRDLFDREALALVSVKNHDHGSLNPYARYRQPVTVEEVLASPRVEGRLTQLMCAPPGDGAACLVLCAPGFRHARSGGARIVASVLTSGRGDDMRLPMSIERATRAAYDQAGLGPEDLDVLELHDATAVGELFVYPYLGLCRDGDAERLVRDRVTWLGGRLPANPSGGLLSRGHPAGATGAAQVVELVWQLEGRCGPRQVPGARIGLAENPGGWLGADAAACCLHILQA